MALYLAIGSLCLILRASAVAYCDDTSECASTTISDSSVLCWGYSSCKGSNITATPSPGYVYCRGFDSCEDATQIIADGVIECSGDFSCDDADEIEGDDGVICSGPNGCQEVTSIKSTSGDVTCSGSYSCKNVDTITASSIARCSGPYGCYGVTTIKGSSAFISGQDAASGVDINITSASGVATIAGYRSAPNTDISGADIIYCYSYESCKGSTLSGNTIYSESRDSAEGATITADEVNCRGQGSCNGATLDVSGDVYLDGKSSGSSVTFSDVDNLYANGELSAINTGSITADGEVQCNGAYSCSSQSGSAITIQADGGDIQCDGYESCRETSLTATDGDIYLRSYYSAYESPLISASGNVYVESEYSAAYADEIDGDEIYCRGYQSCRNAEITASTTVEISGQQGAVSAEITAPTIGCLSTWSCSSTYLDITGDVYLYGSESGSGADITTSTGEVRAASSSSANGATIDSGDDIKCWGRYSCYGADLTASGYVSLSGAYAGDSATINAGSVVYCYSSNSCRESDITAGTSVQLYAQKAAQLATISAPNIYAYGYFSAIDSYIDSKSLTSMQVRLYGYRAGEDAKIVCQDGVNCQIKCSGGGCGGADVYYYDLDDITTTPSECKTDYSGGGTTDDGTSCPELIDATITAPSKLKAMEVVEKMEDDGEVGEEDEDEDLGIMDVDLDVRKHKEERKNNVILENKPKLMETDGMDWLSMKVLFIGLFIGSFVTLIGTCYYFERKFKNIQYEELV